MAKKKVCLLIVLFSLVGASVLYAESAPGDYDHYRWESQNNTQNVVFFRDGSVAVTVTQMDPDGTRHIYQVVAVRDDIGQGHTTMVYRKEQSILLPCSNLPLAHIYQHQDCYGYKVVCEKSRHDNMDEEIIVDIDCN